MTSENIQLTIHDVTYPGKGVARHDGMVHFVAGALTGETVLARVQRQHKNFVEAELVEVLTPSPHRVTPACPLASRHSNDGLCHGCEYQHATHEEELRIKAQQVASLLKKLACITVDAPPPVFASPSPTGYRNKLTLHVGEQVGETIPLGYVGEDNTTILDVPACPLGNDAINRHLSELRTREGFLASLPPGGTVTLRHTEADGVSTYVTAPPRRAETTTAAPEVAPDTTLITEASVVGPLAVPLRSFFQINPSVSDALNRAVQKHIQAIQPAHVLDLYCGVGIFSLIAATAGVPQILGLDSDSAAIKSARTSARKQRIKTATFQTTLVEVAVPKLTLNDAEHGLVIVDPPRRGLATPVLDWLLKFQPGHLIYVSCAPDTLARDLGKLKCAGYTINDIQIFDMFPRTAHMEVLVHLQRQ